jgi:hypothetical protein
MFLPISSTPPRGMILITPFSGGGTFVLAVVVVFFAPKDLFLVGGPNFLLLY